MKHKLIIVEDHEIFLEGLRLKLNDFSDEIEIIACAMNRNDLQRFLNDGKIPDVLLLDYQLPDTNGIELSKYLKSQPLFAAIKIIMLSAFQSYTIGSSTYDLIIEAIDAGIDGYMLKDSSVEEIVTAIRNVTRNKCFYIGESIDIQKLTTRVISDRRILNSMVRLFRKGFLSNRETEILQQLAQGCSAKEIANQLHISEDTITNYKDSIKQKIEEKYNIRLKNVVEMVVWSIKNKIIDI